MNQVVVIVVQYKISDIASCMKTVFVGNQMQNETWCIVLLWLKVNSDQVSYFKPQHLWISLEIK